MGLTPNYRSFRALAGSLALLGLCACAARPGPRRVQALLADGRWLYAREAAEEALRQAPNNQALVRAIADLDKRAENQAANSDFDPKRYFYAQAYLEFFKHKRYLKAVEDMEQVLSYELDNEELLHFMDRAQPKLEEEQRLAAEKVNSLIVDGVNAYREGDYARTLHCAQRALALAPADPRARKLAAKAQEALTPTLSPAVAAKSRSTPAPADPEWLQARFEEALKAYIKGDILTTRDILRELVAKTPDNAQYQRHLDRIQKELPPDRR